MYISAYSTKIRTSGNRISGDRTSGGPPVNKYLIEGAGTSINDVRYFSAGK